VSALFKKAETQRPMEKSHGLAHGGCFNGTKVSSKRRDVEIYF
jgi:hypothetical protein